MSNGRSLPQSWPGLSAAARLRLVLPEIEAWAREYGSHDVIVADLADRGLVVSKALLRKELLKYRRKMAATPGAGSSAKPLSAHAVTQVRTDAVRRPTEAAAQQNTEALVIDGPRDAWPSKLRDVLDPKTRYRIADEFMHVHERPRLGRKKWEEEQRAKALPPEPE